MIMDNIKFDTMSFFEFFFLIIILIVIFYIWYLEPRMNRKKVSNKNEHGSSKFADKKEIETTFVKEKLVGCKTIGFPIWYEKKNGKFENVYIDDKSPHYILIGSTGSGKSVTVVLNECLMFATAEEKHSVVVTDPKGEIFRATSRVFKDNNYNVITIDFRNPNKSNKINIMQPIINEWKEYCKYNKIMLFLCTHFIKTNRIKLQNFTDEKYVEKIKKRYLVDEYLLNVIIDNKSEISEMLNNRTIYNNDLLMDKLKTKDVKQCLASKTNSEILSMIKSYLNESSKHQAEANRLVISLADLIFVDKQTNDKFWINSAKQLFIGIVGIFLEDYQNGIIRENQINISSVKKFQNSSLIKENQTYLQVNINNRKYGRLSKDYLTSILSSAENTYKSITAVFGEKMAIFDDLQVENITSQSEFEFTELGKRPTVLYLIVPDEDKAYFQLVTIIIGMLIKDLTKFANLPQNKGRLPIKVEWILDEFANCPPIDSIEVSNSVGRSRGFRFQYFIQSFAQLEQVYGKEIASILIDNSALCYLKTNSVECAERIVKKLGRSTIITNSMSMSTDPFKIGANQTQSLMGKELLTANEVMRLKYKTIIFPTVSNPIFRDTYLYTDVYPQYKNVKELERTTKVLKRMTSNYYTVEELREKNMNLNSMYIQQLSNQFKRKEREKTDSNISPKKEINNNIIEKIQRELLINLNNQVTKLDDNTYEIKVDKLISNNLVNNFESYDKSNYTFALSRNKNKHYTKITIWKNTALKL